MGKTLEETENLQNICSVVILTFYRESSRIVSLQKDLVLTSFTLEYSFLQGRHRVRYIHICMLDIPLQF